MGAKCLPLIQGHLIKSGAFCRGDHFQDGFAELLGFGWADAVDFKEFFFGAWGVFSQAVEGLVGEDSEGGDVVLVGQFGA